MIKLQKVKEGYLVFFTNGGMTTVELKTSLANAFYTVEFYSDLVGIIKKV